MSRKQKIKLIRIICAAVITVVLSFIPMSKYLKFAMFMIPYLIVGYDILKKAFFGIIHRQLLDENFLMSVATVGAFVIALLRTGDYFEGVAVMLFYQIGELFQSYAVGKSRKSISELMDIRPESANVLRDGAVETVEPDEVCVGEIIVVRPGERIPIDCTVVSGESELDTAALTGESLPTYVGVGDRVVSGCINMTGELRLRTEKKFVDSAVSKILEMTENASSRKSRPEKFITKFARFYTPSVCIAALLLAVLPPLYRLVFTELSPDFAEWIYRALTFLVISCPCALVISIPLSFFAGIGRAGREGILVKGSNYLEAISCCDTVVFDKTGTLTTGKFVIDEILPRDNVSREELLFFAAYAESASTHPIGEGIVGYYAKAIDISRIGDITELSGKGVCASIDGKQVCAGNLKLMELYDVSVPSEHKADTADKAASFVYVSADGRYIGKIKLIDEIKPSAYEALSELAQVGIRKTVMLTGDSDLCAKRVAAELGITEYRAELLPSDKISEIEKLIHNGQKVIFVGDGINDAPVLTRADVGVSMGALGSDAAIEASDIVIMDDDIRKLALSIRLSVKCRKIVYQNIIFSIGIKLICLVLGALGIASMNAAIFADVGVMVIAVLNSMRMMIKKNQNKKSL